ncbi:hypothetical protein IscW_ISCW015214 [Ixodes scapularis]|uniref:Uncharacterized protein n=1 Tax=Ixodes scapularis TaxID=6945 RepID=B7QML7_IXOSC|nr:hypothetical protein IscW_ISCW015214 [Ixodes scapularis]|eukprot:XP_002399908.1 hypothetical protein IscW_ISCW015214 [Ixodes scapularis]
MLRCFRVGEICPCTLVFEIVILGTINLKSLKDIANYNEKSSDTRVEYAVPGSPLQFLQFTPKAHQQPARVLSPARVLTLSRADICLHVFLRLRSYSWLPQLGCSC